MDHETGVQSTGLTLCVTRGEEPTVAQERRTFVEGLV